METRGGGVYRVVGRKAPALVKGTTAAVAVACAGSSVAYLRAAPAATSSGRPVPSPSLPVEVRDAQTGSLVTSIAPTGTPVAVALSGDVLALLEQTSSGMTLAWYDPAGGDALGEIPVPATTTGLAAGRGVIAYRVGRSIRVVEAAGKRSRVLAKAAETPIGLTVDGLRVAWAENVAGRGRIRAVTVG